MNPTNSAVLLSPLAIAIKGNLTTAFFQHAEFLGSATSFQKCTLYTAIKLLSRPELSLLGLFLKHFPNAFVDSEFTGESSPPLYFRWRLSSMLRYEEFYGLHKELGYSVTKCGFLWRLILVHALLVVLQSTIEPTHFGEHTSNIGGLGVNTALMKGYFHLCIDCARFF